MSLKATEFSDTIPEIRLSELIDVESVRSMMEGFHSLTGIPMKITDHKGSILASAGWQEICSKFHRANPGTAENCILSGINLTADIRDGEFRLYKCKNGMWDMATPLFFGKSRIGYLFTGQFFFADEEPDTGFFMSQAAKYGFDVEEYIEALKKVPRVERSYIEKSESFFIRLAETLANLGYGRMKLEKALEDTQVLLANLRDNKFLLEEAQSIAHLGSWEYDLRRKRLTWSDEVYRIFGTDPMDFIPSYDGFLERIHPDDREAVSYAYLSSVSSGMDTYETEHRIIRKNNGETRWVREKCNHIKDREGRIVKSIGIVHDITDLRKTEAELIESRKKILCLKDMFKRKKNSVGIKHTSLPPAFLKPPVTHRMKPAATRISNQKFICVKYSKNSPN